jgi:hypothetical protein
MDDAERERLRLEATIARLQRAAEARGGTPAPLARVQPGQRAPRPVPDGLRLRRYAVLGGLAAALVLLLFVVRRPSPLFLVLALVMAAVAARLWRGGGGPPAPGGADVPQERDEELRRTEEALDRVRDALRRAPAAVHGFVEHAELALDAIGRGARVLAQRAAALCALVGEARLGRADREHEELVARRAATGDAGAQRILDQALAASELKRRRLRELQAWSERASAEQLRVRHMLETLHLDIERAISSELPRVQGETSRSLVRLTDEVAAIADALESVSPLLPGDLDH